MKSIQSVADKSVVARFPFQSMETAMFPDAVTPVELAPTAVVVHVPLDKLMVSDFNSLEMVPKLYTRIPKIPVESTGVVKLVPVSIAAAAAV